ncbi:hypothetical protein [Streptomyces sp. NPDC058758]|uniref:hypothetical protein n=1 Tax=Streptomyces sp. NPDC058758 TaxID=3346627 RepID=UPI0036A9F140
MRRILDRALNLAAGLLLLALALLAAYAMGAALDGAAADAGRTATVAPHGDDNGDGRIDEDESGWDCATMGNRQCGPAPAPVSADCTGPGPCTAEGLPAECRNARAATVLCVTVASRPGGPTLLRALPHRPGTPEYAAALRVLAADTRPRY